MSKLLGGNTKRDRRKDLVRDIDINLNPLYNIYDYTRLKVQNLVLTNKGELIMRPDEGTIVSTLLMENISADDIQNVEEDIRSQLESNIPELSSINVNIDLKDIYIIIRISYKILDKEDKVELNIEL